MNGRIQFALCIVALSALSACAVSPVNPGTMEPPSRVLTLEDVRFSAAHVRQGVWSPAQFERSAGGGIYCTEPAITQRMPILFIHGMYGSPRGFESLMRTLDPREYRLCAFYYASGSSLHGIADELSRALLDMKRDYGMDRLVIVAHSIGGLIARDVLLNQRSFGGVRVPMLITLSTPWGGINSAAVGVRWSPVVVSSWHDIATGSAYLQSLFVDSQGAVRALPKTTQHHLLFSYRRSWSRLGVSSDSTTTVASQLQRTAQEQAFRVHGFDASHAEMLRDPTVADLLHQLLASVPGANASDQATAAAQKNTLQP